VLAVELAIVGDEEDVGVVQLPRGAEGLDDRANAIVDRPQRFELMPIALVDFAALP
jgi:hypothetical protein